MRIASGTFQKVFKLSVSAVVLTVGRENLSASICEFCFIFLY